MKNLKKLIAVVLTFTLVFSAMAVGFAGTFSDVKDDAPYASAVARLQSLGLVSGMPDGTYQPDSAVTRAQMIAFVNAAQGLQDAAKLAVGPTKFKDVPATFWAAGDINIADPSGYPDGTFKPNNTVTYPEALALILRALGYTADYSWPYGVIAKATNVGITDGVTLSANATINRGQMAMLINNALDLNINKYVDGAESDTGKKLLSKVAKIDEYVVVATHDTNSNVDEGKVQVKAVTTKDDNITISDSTKTIAAGSIDFNLYVGKRVNVYSVNGTPLAVDVLSSDKTFTGDDKFDVVSNVVYNDDKKVATLDTDASVVYNGVEASVSDLHDNKSTVDGATVTLTDVNEDGKYDFVVVTDAFAQKNVVVTKDVKDGDKYINATSSLRIAGDPVKTVVVKGSVNKLADIHENDVINYAKSIDGSRVTILVVRDKVEGKVTKVSEGDKTIATINGKDYEVLNDINSDDDGLVSLDQEGTFVLNNDGKIVYFIGEVTSDNYAVLVTASDLGGLNGKVKLVTPDGKTTIYNADVSSAAYNSAKDILVTYKVNSDNVVTELTQVGTTVANAVYNYDSDTNTLSKDDNKYYLSDSTAIYNVSDDKYTAVKLSDITTDTLTVKAIYTDDYNHVKAILVSEKSLAGKGDVASTVYGYVTNVVTINTSDGTKYEITAFANGLEETYDTAIGVAKPVKDKVFALPLSKDNVVVDDPSDQGTGISGYVVDYTSNGLKLVPNGQTQEVPYALASNVTVVEKDSDGNFRVLGGLNDLVKGTSQATASDVTVYLDASGRVAVILITD
ncbi:MAG: trimeric autotransporter adhesin [Thermoanaerobacterium sp.]|nr:trimeric autotransporter adhesin [Thermoanaerobacterium sp.]